MTEPLKHSNDVGNTNILPNVITEQFGDIGECIIFASKRCSIHIHFTILRFQKVDRLRYHLIKE